MTSQDKIDSIKNRNGIKSFGYSLDDLENYFENYELKELANHGLIDDFDCMLTILKRELNF